jgi:alkaline phosphatase D
MSLKIAAPAGIAAECAPFVIRRSFGHQQKWPDGDPFKLGVAAGSPASEGFVLWTRLAP